MNIGKVRSLSLLSLFVVVGSSLSLSGQAIHEHGSFVSSGSDSFVDELKEENSVDEVVYLDYSFANGKQQILTMNQYDHYEEKTKFYNISFSDVDTPMKFMGTSTERDSLYSYQTKARKSERDDFTQIVLNTNDMKKTCLSFVGGLYSGDELIGTAFLLSNGCVLTAAHCVYLGGRYWDNLNVRFGYLGVDQWEIASYVWQSFVPSYWVQNCKDKDEHENLLPYDWSILELEDTGLQEDYGACTIASNRDLTNSNYMSVGFPQNKGGKPVASPGYGVKSQTTSRYETYSFSYYGNSGGPVFQMNHEWNSSIQADTYFDYIVGISSSGYFDSESVSSMTYNYSGVMRITNPMIQFVEVLPL